MQPSKEMKSCHLQRHELEGIMLSEIIQLEKDNYHMISLIEKVEMQCGGFVG